MGVYVCEYWLDDQKLAERRLPSPPEIGTVLYVVGTDEEAMPQQLAVWNVVQHVEASNPEDVRVEIYLHPTEIREAIAWG
jgi:hypothetical protein